MSKKGVWHFTPGDPIEKMPTCFTCGAPAIGIASDSGPRYPASCLHDPVYTTSCLHDPVYPTHTEHQVTIQDMTTKMAWADRMAVEWSHIIAKLLVPGYTDLELPNHERYTDLIIRGVTEDQDRYPELKFSYRNCHNTGIETHNGGLTPFGKAPITDPTKPIVWVRPETDMRPDNPKDPRTLLDNWEEKTRDMLFEAYWMSYKDLIEVDLSNLVPFGENTEKSQKDGQTWRTTLTLYRDRDLWPLLPNLQHARGLQAPWKT